MQLEHGCFLSHVILRRRHSLQLKPTRFLRAARPALSSPSAEPAGEPPGAPEAEPAAERERFLRVVEVEGEGWEGDSRSVRGEWVEEWTGKADITPGGLGRGREGGEERRRRAGQARGGGSSRELS